MSFSPLLYTRAAAAMLLLPETTNRQSEIDEDPPIFAL
jgi:hypothetical protein